jgi:uncharacterized protein YyaL (SSP411 family)
MVGQSSSVILVGDKKDADVKQIIEALKQHYLPNTVIQLKQPDSVYKLLDGKPSAYVCEGKTCYPPVNSPEAMLKLLKTK